MASPLTIYVSKGVVTVVAAVETEVVITDETVVLAVVSVCIFDLTEVVISVSCVRGLVLFGGVVTV